MAQSGKFGIKKLAKSSGTLGIFDIIGDTQVRIVIENAGPSNVVAVYGRIQGQNSYELIDTVTASSSKLIDVALFDFLDLEVITYDSLGIYIDIAGSGFSNAAGGSSGPVTGSVTVTNFPSSQNVVVTNSPTVNTGLNPLTDAQLRAAPIAVNTITGFATEAKQDSQITILNDIKTNSDLASTAQNQLDTITALGTLATEASLTAQTAFISSIDSKLEAENIRQKILKAADRESYITYADFGTKNQRVTKIEYLTSTIPANIASKVIAYTLVGNKYKRNSINWIIT